MIIGYAKKSRKEKNWTIWFKNLVLSDGGRRRRKRPKPAGRLRQRARKLAIMMVVVTP